MPRAIFRIRALVQQESFHFRGAAKHELIGGSCHQDALLHHAQLDFQNLFEVFGTQGLEHHRLVDAVHEFRSEFPSRRFDRSAINFLIQAGVHLRGFVRETESAIDQVTHLTGSQIRRHDDDALRQIDAPVITQGQRSFIQDAKQ